MSRWKLTLTRLRWSAGSLSPSIWMSSLFPTILGMQGPEGTLHARGFPSVQYEVGGGWKGEEGRKREREIQHFVCTHTHKSKLTCLIIVDAFPLLYLLSPVLTNRRGMWAVSWNLPSSRAVSCTAPCPPHRHQPASQQVLDLSSHCCHLMTSSSWGGCVPHSPSGLPACQFNCKNYVARERCIWI